MKVVAFLPAKGTSERIENKNTRLLDGKPLFLHTLHKLEGCEFIDEVYLDSESSEIFDLASDSVCKRMLRDPDLASNLIDGHKLFYNEASKVDADIYIQILCTSPFITKETIRKGVNILLNNSQYDSVVLVKKEKQYLWSKIKPLYDFEHIPNSVDLPETVIETMGLYITRKHVVLETKKRIGSRPYLLEASPLEAIDVNYPEEFELANFIAAGMREKERQLFKNLAVQLSSSMLSDILDDLGVASTITSLKLNLGHKKIFGRAKTLHLRALKDGESYEGIYDALNSYSTIVNNDIIVVQNECQDFAYFGELNANLALRSGAVGAIIGGKTRDSYEVAQLDFPVYSMGGSCKDVRKRATVASINKKICINGIEVSVNDLIYGDADGIVVIPKNLESQVLSLAMETIAKEKTILRHIVEGKLPEDILQNSGEF